MATQELDFTLVVEQGEEMAIEKTVNFTLEVLAPADIFLSFDPMALAVRQGRMAVFNIVANGINGFVGNISFALEGIPAGVDYDFSVNPIVTSGTSVLSIDTADLPVGPPLPLVLRVSGVEA